MKLSLVKKICVPEIKRICSAAALADGRCAFLASTQEQNYAVFVVNGDGYTKTDLPYTQKYFAIESRPVLFAFGRGFAVLKDKGELLIYTGEGAPKSLPINNTQALPSRISFSYQSPIASGDLKAFCFEKDIFDGSPRYIAFLKITEDGASWNRWICLDASQIPHHRHPHPPKIDGVFCKDSELYVFTSGGQTTSVPKWGMDYYACLRCGADGAIAEILLDSGDLKATDGKKRGVNGVFCSSQKHLILTPVFQSDEWRGKQRIFSLADREIYQISYPRGIGKSPRLLEHEGEYFWVYLPQSSEIAICKASK